MRSANIEGGGEQTQSSLGLRYFHITHETTDVQLAVRSSGSDVVSANNNKSKTQKMCESDESMDMIMQLLC